MMRLMHVLRSHVVTDVNMSKQGLFKLIYDYTRKYYDLEWTLVVYIYGNLTRNKIYVSNLVFG
jgi:hypothetical protein